MLQIAPENIFVIFAFETILSGLLSLVLAWALCKHEQLRKDRVVGFLLAALAGLALAFFLCSSLNFYEFYYQENLLPYAAETVAFPVFIAATVLLGIALRQCAGGATYSRSSQRLLRLAFLALFIGLLILLLVHAGRGGESAWILWGMCHVALLGSLTMLAHLVELLTQDLFLKFFIRLNLTFIVLAGFVIVVVTRVQRQEYVNFAVRETADLMEFLRGHVMYFHNLGGDSRQVLSHPDIIKRIVSDFGKVPALETVSIYFEDARLVMKIEPDGMVRHFLQPSVPRQTRSDFTAMVDGKVLRLATPIYRRQEIAGWIELEQSVAVMNRGIAEQILIIFSAFTIMVIFSGVLTGIIVSQADRTIQRQYLQLEETHRQLLQAAKLAAVGEMAGGIAHEINNPLAIISGRADYLLTTAKRGRKDDYIEDLVVIQRNASRATRIIGDLLEFARPHPLDRSRCNLNIILDDTIDLMKPRLGQRKIRVTKKFSQLPDLSLDRDRMQQVFVNLINNAIDASPESATIELETSYDAGRKIVTARIKNTGNGIPGEVIKKVFDPFFTTKARGTGLGLSVSYAIIRDHDGQIQVESVPGQGTSFTITLPQGEAGKEK